MLAPSEKLGMYKEFILETLDPLSQGFVVWMRGKVRQVRQLGLSSAKLRGKIYPEPLGSSLILSRLSQSWTDDDDDNDDDGDFRLRDFRLPPRSSWELRSSVLLNSM